MPYNIIILSVCIAYLVLLLLTLRQILWHIKHPSKTLSWILVVIFLPIIGILFYRFMGRNIKRDKIFQQRKAFYNNIGQELKLEDLPKSKKNLVQLLHTNNSAAISYQNDVRVLKNGEATFDALFSALKQARETIHLDYYIIESGEKFDELTLILEERIKDGVKVRLLYDGFGSLELEQKYFDRLSKIGVEYHKFMPFDFINNFDYLNYRNHRKIVIVDAKVAFTGGMNITDKYTSYNDNIGFWRDTFVQITGPAALDFEKIFSCDWFYAKGNAYAIKEPNDTIENQMGSIVQVVSSGPDSQYKGIMHEYFTIVTDAEDYVYIVTPYFIPGEAILTALKTSALSGVDVRLMLPYVSDSKWLKWCMFTFLEELLGAGVRIFLYHEGFLHSKVLVSDDIVSSIGTANVDERSFDKNFEVNAIVYDEKTAHTLKEHFMEDMQLCEELALSTFPHRDDRNKFMESLARLGSPML